MKPKKDPPIRKRKARATPKKKKKKPKRKVGEEGDQAEPEEEEEDNGEPIPFFSSLPECQKHSNATHIFKIIFPVSS
jgi:hypothetical protein